MITGLTVSSWVGFVIFLLYLLCFILFIDFEFCFCNINLVYFFYGGDVSNNVNFQ